VTGTNGEALTFGWGLFLFSHLGQVPSTNPLPGSTKPQQATKPSKIRDVEFGLHDADHHNHGASFIR